MDSPSDCAQTISNLVIDNSLHTKMKISHLLNLLKLCNFFSGFSESGVKISDFFYNSDLHMKDLVASQVEVVASCLIQMVIGNISFMF